MIAIVIINISRHTDR